MLKLKYAYVFKDNLHSICIYCVFKGNSKVFSIVYWNKMAKGQIQSEFIHFDSQNVNHFHEVVCGDWYYGSYKNRILPAIGLYLHYFYWFMFYRTCLMAKIDRSTSLYVSANYRMKGHIEYDYTSQYPDPHMHQHPHFYRMAINFSVL